MEPAKLHKTAPSATTGPGDLVLQNGRHAGQLALEHDFLEVRMCGFEALVQSWGKSKLTCSFSKHAI